MPATGNRHIMPNVPLITLSFNRDQNNIVNRAKTPPKVIQRMNNGLEAGLPTTGEQIA